MSIKDKIDQDYIEEFGESERKLKYILDLADTIHSSRDMSQLLENISHISMDYFKCDGCYYGTIYEDILTIKQESNKKDPDSVKVYNLNHYPILKSSLAEGKVFAIEEINTTDLLDENLKVELANKGIISFIAKPVLEAGNILGTFALIENKPRKWAKEEMVLLERITRKILSFIELIKSKEENERLVHSLKRSVEESKLLVEELKRIDERRTRFLSLLSHEFRNPLATISLGLDLMDYTEGNMEDQRKTRGTLKRQTKQLMRLVEDLLNMTRMAQNKFELELERLELNIILEEVIRDNWSVFNKKGIRLERDIEKEKIIIEGDKSRLIQVVENLLNNSFKFTPEGGRVSLSLTRNQEIQEAYISIKDTGRGISQDMLEDIFKPYFQIRNNQGKSLVGLGIGLSIVKDIIERHRGSIKALSQGDNMGTEMLIRLPIL